MHPKIKHVPTNRPQKYGFKLELHLKPPLDSTEVTQKKKLRK
jgi:hypothetical protein